METKTYDFLDLEIYLEQEQDEMQHYIDYLEEMHSYYPKMNVLQRFLLRVKLYFINLKRVSF